MRKFLIAAAAGLIVGVTGSLTAPRADAITLALPTGMTNQLNMVEQVALCFYVDGWNGPGITMWIPPSPRLWLPRPS